MWPSWKASETGRRILEEVKSEETVSDGVRRRVEIDIIRKSHCQDRLELADRI